MGKHDIIWSLDQYGSATMFSAQQIRPPKSGGANSMYIFDESKGIII